MDSLPDATPQAPAPSRGAADPEPPSAEGAAASRPSARELRLQAAARRWSWGRLLAFFGLVAGGALAFESGGAGAAIAACAAALFAVSFSRHSQCLDALLALEREETLEAERGLRRAGACRPGCQRPKLGWDASRDTAPLDRGLRIFLPEPETVPLDPGVIEDLALLPPPRELSAEAAAGKGARSIFGFFDWTSTTLGSRRLLRMLLHPLTRSADIEERQGAVREAAESSALRESVLEGLFPLRKRPLPDLAKLLREASFAGRRGLLAASHLFGSLAPLALLVLVATGNYALVYLLVPCLVINAAIIGKNVQLANAARERVSLFGPVLGALRDLDARLSRLPLRGADWIALGRTLAAAAPQVRRLERHVRLLEIHDFGPVYELWNLFTLWELRILPVADGAFKAHREELEAALGALAEAEAVVCLSLPLAEREDFELPLVSSAKEPFVEAKSLAHPLLPPGGAVFNPLSLGRGARILLVTGSNMAGKSTYLKTVGVSLILASAGGPVRGRAFHWTPLGLYTDVNVRDSLDDGKSYFQVEVERVRGLLEAIQRGPFVLAALDELFRGTNSQERLAIAWALLQFYAGSGALALVATHDHGLAKLALEAGDAVRNVHFRETIEGAWMRFDYVLRDGPVATRNALKVLELNGYPLAITSAAKELLSPEARGELNSRRSSPG